MIENGNYRCIKNLLVTMYVVLWILRTTEAYYEILVLEIAVGYLLPLEDSSLY